MKLKKLLKENTDNIRKDLATLFYVDGDYHFDSSKGGWVFEGDLRADNKENLVEIPFPIAEVHGEFSIEACGIQSLKNFPRKSSLIKVAACSGLKTLNTDGLIESESINFQHIANEELTNLSGFEVKTKNLVLRAVRNLKTLSGLKGHVQNLIVGNLQNIEEDFSKIPASLVNHVTIDLEKGGFLKSKLILPILFQKLEENNGDFATVKLEKLEKTKDEVLKKILIKYRYSGAQGMIPLIRELRLTDDKYKLLTNI